MTSYRLSHRAVANLDEIFEYSVEQFGLSRAGRYRDSLRSSFEMLAANPKLGRAARSIRAGVRRHEHRRHIILYEISDDGILVLAVIHRRRLTALKA